MQINKLLTKINLKRAGNTGRIKYIVIHYVGATGGAKANCQYYASQYVGASAHYFVGFSGEVWQSVEDKDIAWHCGAKHYKHPECRNANSIGIELCVRNKGSKADTSRDWYFEDATVAGAVQLTKELMAKYNIPADHVIRHYDVTGKICPNPYVYNHTKHTWQDFKTRISGGSSAPVQSSPVKNWHATGTATCGGNSVNVRQSPNGSVLFQLNRGNRFEINGETSGSWAKIKANNTVGWMATQYVVLDQPKKEQIKPKPAGKIVLTADGIWGSDTTKRLQQYFGLPIDGVISNQLNSYKHLCPGIVSAEWSNTPNGGSMLVRKMQQWLGVKKDGYIGSGFNCALQRKFGMAEDGVLSHPSQCITALQIWINGH
ncbi:MAG TPA: hypothetical protein DCX82_15830 [Lachnospiraceae bacterium]|jgi:N-acetylmuramoyl-L-alanine amidase CwlA|nr:hypothetical protein [Lachnospiraceae bacterium]